MDRIKTLETFSEQNMYHSHVRNRLVLRKQKSALLLIFTISLLFALAACSSNDSTVQPQASATPAQQSSPTPTPLPSGMVLYKSDFSHGLTGMQNARGWKVTNGELESNSGTGTGSFTIQYQPTMVNFAVEVRVQIVHVIQKNGGFFILTTPQTQQKDGYECGVTDLKGSINRPNGDHAQAQAMLRPSSDASPGTGRPIDYEPGTGWRVYRLEVRDGVVSLRIDGVQVGSASSAESKSISLGPIEFSSDEVVLRVSDVRVVTL